MSLSPPQPSSAPPSLFVFTNSPTILASYHWDDHSPFAQMQQRQWRFHFTYSMLPPHCGAHTTPTPLYYNEWRQLRKYHHPNGRQAMTSRGCIVFSCLLDCIDNSFLLVAGFVIANPNLLTHNNTQSPLNCIFEQNAVVMGDVMMAKRAPFTIQLVLGWESV